MDRLKCLSIHSAGSEGERETNEIEFFFMNFSDRWRVPNKIATRLLWMRGKFTALFAPCSSFKLFTMCHKIFQSCFYLIVFFSFFLLPFSLTICLRTGDLLSQLTFIMLFCKSKRIFAYFVKAVCVDCVLLKRHGVNMISVCNIL